MENTREDIIKFIKDKEIDDTLGYSAVNDFVMRIVQIRKRLEVYSNKKETINKMLQNAKTPNDFYNIYKVKGVESLNRHILKIIGHTEFEKEIEDAIKEGNSKVTISKP